MSEKPEVYECKSRDIDDQCNMSAHNRCVRQMNDWLTGKLVIDLDGLSGSIETALRDVGLFEYEYYADAILTLLKSKDLNKGGE